MDPDVKVEQESISPGASIIIPLIIGSAVLFVAAMFCHKYIENIESHKSRERLIKAKDMLGECLTFMEEKKYDEAEKLSGEVIKLMPDLHTAYFFRAKARSALGKDEEAVEDYTRSLELNQNSQDTYHDYYNRGVLFYKLNKDKQAESDLSEAIKVQQHSAEAYRTRAMVRKRMGDTQGYDHDISMAIKLGYVPPPPTISTAQ